jgi:hypothetical protein
MAKRKRTNNDLQNITHKTKDQVARTPLKTGAELRCSERVSSYAHFDYPFTIFKLVLQKEFTINYLQINNYFSGMLNPVYAMLLFFFFRIK